MTMMISGRVTSNPVGPLIDDIEIFIKTIILDHFIQVGQFIEVI